jgi:hypothetical protein
VTTGPGGAGPSPRHPARPAGHGDAAPIPRGAPIPRRAPIPRGAPIPRRAPIPCGGCITRWG